MSRRDERARGSGRTVGLGLVAVLVALVIAYLGRCLPGLGTGGAPSSGATRPDAPAAPDPEGGEDRKEAKVPAEAAAQATSFTVRGDTCAAGDEKAVACEALCASLPGEHDTTTPVVIHGAHGTHEAVSRLRECLEKAGFSEIAVRTE